MQSRIIAEYQTWCDGLVQAITFLYPQPFVVNGPAWVWRKHQDISVGLDYRKKFFIADGHTWTLNYAIGTWIIERPSGDEDDVWVSSDTEEQEEEL